MYMKLCTRHVDNTGHTFITIFLLQSFSCKLTWLVFLDSSLCQLRPYQQFHSSCSLWCLMSTARNVFFPRSTITLSRYIWSFTIFLYDSYKMIPQKAMNLSLYADLSFELMTMLQLIFIDLSSPDLTSWLYHYLATMLTHKIFVVWHGLSSSHWKPHSVYVYTITPIFLLLYNNQDVKN